jgi:hypothetical protein
MRRPQSSKNDARNANPLDLLIPLHKDDGQKSLRADIAPFRNRSHGIVQLETQPFR